MDAGGGSSGVEEECAAAAATPIATLPDELVAKVLLSSLDATSVARFGQTNRALSQLVRHRQDVWRELYRHRFRVRIIKGPRFRQAWEDDDDEVVPRLHAAIGPLGPWRSAFAERVVFERLLRRRVASLSRDFVLESTHVRVSSEVVDACVESAASGCAVHTGAAVPAVELAATALAPPPGTSAAMFAADLDRACNWSDEFYCRLVYGQLVSRRRIEAVERFAALPAEEQDTRLLRGLMLIEDALDYHVPRMWSACGRGRACEDEMASVFGDIGVACAELRGAVVYGRARLIALVDEVVKELAALVIAHVPRGRADSAAAKLDALRAAMRYREFRGDTASYYSPANSMVSQVIAWKRGNPITLSVIAIAVAREAGLDLKPINFPGHFLVAARVDDGSVRFLDCFNDFKVYSADELAEAFSVPGHVDADTLAPVAAKDVWARVTRNVINTVTRVMPRSAADDATSQSLALEMEEMQQAFTGSITAAGSQIKAGDFGAVYRRVDYIRRPDATGDEVRARGAAQLAEMMAEGAAIELESEKRARRRAAGSDAPWCGALCVHAKYGYTCVVARWDETCEASEHWQAHMGVRDLARGADQPFYLVLVGDGSVRYAAEENLVTLDRLEDGRRLPTLSAAAGDKQRLLAQLHNPVVGSRVLAKNVIRAHSRVLPRYFTNYDVDVMSFTPNEGLGRIYLDDAAAAAECAARRLSWATAARKDIQ